MKKTQWLFAILFVLFCSSFALAQASMPASPVTASQVIDRNIANTEHEFVPAAEAMPAEKFDFAPTAGEFKGVRTFAQQLKHLAHANYVMASAILQEKPPVDIGGDNGPDALTTKVEIVKFLKDSFAYAHKAAQSITEKNLLEPVKSPWGDYQVTRLDLATWITMHTFDHYGQMVVYLRMNGIIPPASRPKQ